MIAKDPDEELRDHGRGREADGRAVRSRRSSTCAGRTAPRTRQFFAGPIQAQFSKEAADLLLEIGIIKQLPDMSKLADTQFIK